MYIICIYAFRSIKLKFFRKQMKVVIGNKWSFTRIVAPKVQEQDLEQVLSKQNQKATPNVNFVLKINCDVNVVTVQS